MSDAIPAPSVDDLLRHLESLGSDAVSQIDARINDLHGQISGLQIMRRLVAARHGLVKQDSSPRAVKRPSQAKSARAEVQMNFESKKLNVAHLLAREAPLSLSAITSRVGLPQTTVHGILKDPWFSLDSDGYRLTPAGNQAVK